MGWEWEGRDAGRERRSERVKIVLKQQTSLLEQKFFCGESPHSEFLSLCFKIIFLAGRAGLLSLFLPPVFFLAHFPGLLHLLGSRRILRLFTNRKPGEEAIDTVVR